MARLGPRDGERPHVGRWVEGLRVIESPLPFTQLAGSRGGFGTEEGLDPAEG